MCQDLYPMASGTRSCVDGTTLGECEVPLDLRETSPPHPPARGIASKSSRVSEPAQSEDQR